MLAGFLLVVGNGGVGLLAPLVLRSAVDGLVADLQGAQLLGHAGLILAVALVKAAFQFGMREVSIGASRHIEYDMRQDLFEHVLRLSPSYFDRVRVGDLMARSTSDLNAVRMMLGPGLMYAVNTVLLFVAVVAMMLSVDVRLTLVALAPLPVVSLASWYFGGRIHERYKETQESFSDISSRVQENLAGVRVVRAFSQEEVEIGAFRNLCHDFLRKNLGFARLWGVFYPALELLMGLSFLCILWLGGLQVAHGTISLGTFVAFNAYVAMLNWPMVSLGWVVNLFQRGTASMARINDILGEVPAVRDGPLAARALEGRLEFRHLDFSYGDVPVLVDVNLVIEPGEMVGIVGPTGSGKTTLVRLVPRLYDAPPGTVLVDGVPVHDMPLDSLRSQIGFVPQDSLLFSDTIAHNVAFGSPDASSSEVMQAVEVSQLSSDLDCFPQGLDTAVGEKGVTLSGGQRQRVSISRAVLRDPRILILDDSLSSVDTETEARILERLKAVMRGRTTLLISHRISTVRLADRIVVLDRGRVVDQGTHDDLVARGGLYAELNRRQQLEQELASLGDAP